MAGHRVGEQDVVQLRTGADVVDDQWRASRRYLVGNDADVIQAALQAPRDDVAGTVIGRLVAGRERCAVTAEERSLVRHAAVVDIAVGGFAAGPPLFVDALL